ncbi:MAG: hypothetical protein AAFY60_21235, partial [Myxococcota bacterium]
AFWILMLLGMFNTVAALNFGLEVLYGTPTYPMTRVMIQTVAGAFGIVPLIITVYYASELVWRERAAKMSDVIDATPTPSWVFVVSKFFALSLVIASMFAVALGTAVVVQALKGHSDLELGQYLLRFAVDMMIPSILLAVLACFFRWRPTIGGLGSSAWCSTSLSSKSPLPSATTTAS